MATLKESKYLEIQTPEIYLVIEPSYEVMALFVLRKLIFQSRLSSHPVGLDVWFLVGPFV